MSTIAYDNHRDVLQAKTPVLATVFNAAGWLVVLATVLTAVACFLQGVSFTTVPVTLIVSGTGGLISLILFGATEILNLIAEIEHHASSEKNDATLRVLQKIEGHLEALRQSRNTTDVHGAPG